MVLLRDKQCLLSGVGSGLDEQIAIACTREGAVVHRVAETAVTDLRRLDVLVLDVSAGHASDRFEAADLDQWRRIMDVNLFGNLELAHAAIPAMKAQGAGSIVFVSSTVVRDAPVLHGGEAAAKAALYTAAQVLAKELGPHGIRVNSIVAGDDVAAAECADAVVFFASDLSSVVTGQALDVNGVTS
jgi:NAD(P)-dependent dehydrogenase (short-subunit alcohol dehydrogenase family)